MIAEDIALVRVSTRTAVRGRVDTADSAALATVEREWSPLRAAYLRDRQHAHWNWLLKSAMLKSRRYECHAVRVGEELQGIVMLDVRDRTSRFETTVGEAIVYVEYIEAAPWNLAAIPDRTAYKGVGMSLMRRAVAVSIDRGAEGRIGLHSLADAAAFYRTACGFTSFGADPLYHGLEYFEVTTEAALRLLRGGQK